MNSSTKLPLLPLLLLTMTLASCTTIMEEPEIGSNGDGITFEEFEQLVPRQSDGTYIVEKDMPFYSVDELRAYYDAAVSTTSAGALTVADAGKAVDGLACWGLAERKNLTYCIDQRSVGSRYYDALVTAMDEATGDWEAVANIDFKHVSTLDRFCNRDANVLFRVVQADLGEGTLARAFFPGTSKPQRLVRLARRALFPKIPLAPNVTLRGLLRHELGHTLGFLHEHGRDDAVNSRCDESLHGNPLTPYDDMSVMHYAQCREIGDRGDNRQELSESDKAGVAKLYGSPQNPRDTGLCSTQNVLHEPFCQLRTVGSSIRWTLRDATRCRLFIDGEPETVACRDGAMDLSGLTPGSHSVFMRVQNSYFNSTCRTTVKIESPALPRPSCRLTTTSTELQWTVQNAQSCSYVLDGGASTSIACSNGSLGLSAFGRGTHNLSLTVRGNGATGTCFKTFVAP